jgi:serine/threonine protein phosphatase PrpC
MAPEQGMYTISYGARRDRGLVRQENQDQIVSFDSSVFGQVFLLADGMGGHEGGAIAANMAITGFKQHFQALATKLPLRECLAEASRLTNLDIYEKGNEKDTGNGSLRMGSTLVLCVVSGGSYVVAHAGDSRCYVYREGVLIRLTRDHTAVQKMVDAGILMPEDAKNHPDASVLTRAFGQRPVIELEISEPYSLTPEETLLLCSDGLYGYVEEEAIIQTLQENHDPQAAADALLELALDAGGHDNISIFVIRAEPSSAKTITAPDFPVEAEPAAAHSAVQPLAVAQVQPVGALQPAASQSPGIAKRGNRLRLAWWLIASAFVILSAPIVAVLRPDIVPPAVREKLIAWGIPLPDSRADDSPGVSVAVMRRPVVPAPVATTAIGAEPIVPASGTGSSAMATATADPPQAINHLAEETAAATQPEMATPAPLPAPAGKALVVVVFPPKATAVFMNEVHSYSKKIRDAGFQVTEMPKSVEANSVWRDVAANPATFAPDHMFLSPVFLAGFEKEAARICREVPCSEPGAPVRAGEIKIFQESFGEGGVALFAHPGSTGSPAAKPRE